jgi:outer membrane protein
MKTKAITLLFILSFSFFLNAQETEMIKTWRLKDCIEYALNQNVQVRRSILTNISNELNANQAVNNKLPSVSGSIRQNFSWANTTNSKTGSSRFSGDNSTSYSVSSSMVLYNGSKLKVLINQAKLDMQSGIYDSETIKESISLSILNAYLQVLFNEEQVVNAKRQIEATTEQLNLAQERLILSLISRSDYLQVKSQLASEKLNLANAQSQYVIAKLTLMQLMELPVNDNFVIAHPKLGELVNANILPSAASVYAIALGIKPEVKSAEYHKESAALNEKIAAAGFLPTISADVGVGTAYAHNINTGYLGQLQDQISPSIGLSLSIPIFQKKQVRTNISLAKINYQNAELLEIDTKNQLRKEIEQVCVDVVSAQIEYEASHEQFDATEESYLLAEEKYKNGLINSVDFLFEKTNMIVAESEYLQSKYNLIFSYKILDFYMGKPINL